MKHFTRVMYYINLFQLLRREQWPQIFRVMQFGTIMDFTEARTSTRRALEFFHWENGEADLEHIYNLRLKLKNYVMKITC